jgi:uncharacterized membrane protein YiaA
MITKADCLNILVKLEDNGVNKNEIDYYIQQLMLADSPSIDTLKFIAKNQGIEVISFYEMLRKKHNKAKSPLYTNILKESQDTIIILTCLLVQVVLYSDKLDEVTKASFLKEARATEISSALYNYFATGDKTSCVALLKLIKTDLLVLEGINGRREFE